MHLVQQPRAGERQKVVGGEEERSNALAYLVTFSPLQCVPLVLVGDAATGSGHCLLKGKRYGAAWGLSRRVLYPLSSPFDFSSKLSSSSAKLADLCLGCWRPSVCLPETQTGRKERGICRIRRGNCHTWIHRRGWLMSGWMEGMEREDKHDIIYRSSPVGPFSFCESQVTPRTYRKCRVRRLRMRVNRPEALLCSVGIVQSGICQYILAPT